MAKNTTNKMNELPQPKKKNQLVTFAVIFLIGFVSGIGFTVFKSDTDRIVPTGSGQEQTQSDEAQQAITRLEAEVTAQPKNFQSWVQLGHLYFDSNQVQKAIGAYKKSLEMHSGDANLLTDLGVMYRRAKQPDKALESFDRAIKMDPTHQPSRFNKGIVLMYDLDKPQEALEAWEEVLKINPNAKAANGELLIDAIKHIKEEKNL
jgi:cytochrome c-type biogenesis protein CcmH/NrfG